MLELALRTGNVHTIYIIKSHTNIVFLKTMMESGYR
jgi:hypothetical protein